MKTSRFLLALLCALLPALAHADPSITSQPVATTITAGQGGTLSVVATTTGAGPLTYQWRKFGSPLAGANGSSLALSSTTLPDAGYYDVVVGDGLASVTSKAVRVDIAPAAANYGNVYRPRANAPRIEVISGNVTAIAVDPSDANKIYVAGEFTRINSTVRLNVARFLADGSFDSTWAPVSIIGGGLIRAVLVEADGLIIAGDFSSVGGTPRGRLAKLSKTDGSLITSFTSGAAANGSIFSLVRQVMADASVRFLAGGSFTTYNGTTVNRLIRLDATGSIDPSFIVSPTGIAGFGSDVRALVVDGSGDTATIYAGGLFTSHHGVTTNRNRLVRLTVNGAYDSTFNIGTGLNNSVFALALSGTGGAAKVYAGGQFTSVNDVSTNRNRIARFDATGAYETSFAVGSGFGSDVNALALDAAGNVYVGGGFTSFNNTTTNRNRLLRLTSAGAYDSTFNNNAGGANSTVNALLLREDLTTPANSRLLFGGFFTTWNGNARDSFARVATDAAAALDTAPAATFRRPGIVYAIEPAPDGKWYIGGFFNFIDDQARNHFARLNADGALDSSFTHAGTGFNGSVNALAVQGDGRIVAAGNFTFFNGTARNDILRLLPDATLDSSFNPGTGFNANVNGIQLRPDGRIVAAGNFTTYNAVTRNRLARLQPDGALDTTFDPGAGFTQNFNAPAPLALQSDGKLLAGGTFTAYNGTTANGIVRVLDTGLIDTTYNSGGAGFASNTDVRQIATRLNDQLVVSGAFTTYNGTARSRIARIADTGALDTVFAPNTGANNSVTAFHVQPDDKTILAGFYTAVLGVTRPVFSRFTATGTLDSAFVVPTVINPHNAINVIRADATGNLLVAATRLDFTEFQGRGSFVVLEPAPVPAITAPPVAQTGTAGGAAMFSVTATGENLQFQWLKNGVPLATGGNVTGATAASLQLSNLTLADVASYSVVVTNLYGTVTSTAVPLTGSAPLPTITTQPVAVSGTAGGGASLTVSASPGAGGGTLAYQWRKFGVPVAGANSDTLTLTNLGLDAAGYYDVVINDGLSVRTSAGAQLSVRPITYAGGLRPRASFEPRVELVGIVTRFASHADGRFYATGSFTQLDGSVAQGIVRLLADGARDPSWNSPLITGAVNHVAIQANNQVVIAGAFGYVGGANQFRLARLNEDGSLDSAFAAKVGSGVSGGNVNAIAIQPADQKILLAGAFIGVNGYLANRFIRLHPDGSPDSTFAIGTGFDNAVNAFVLQPDKKIVAVGNFTAFNGNSATRIARLTEFGAFDSTFVTGTGFEFAPAAIALQPADNKLVVVGSFVTYNGVTSNGIVRLSSLGARESGFPAGVGFGGLSNTVGPLSVALQTVASTDYLVIGGNFTTYNGATLNRLLVRIAATDGAVDAALNTTLGTAGLNNTVRHVAIQGTTNQILVGGPITVVNTTARSGLVRFNADGTLDSLNRQFLEPGQVFAVQPVANGKFVIGGAFSSVGGQPVANLARLEASGALDTSFNSGGTGPTNAVRAIVQQGDGSLIVGGNFTGYNGVGTGVNRVARLSANGVLDTAFATAFGSGFNNQVNALALLPDGRIAVGGSFTLLNAVTTNRVARLSTTGAPDTAFNTANGTAFNNSVNTLVVHPDGRISAGGAFTTFAGAGMSRVGRLLADGGADPTFAVGTGLNLTSSQTGSAFVNALALQPDGHLLVGGYFGVFNGFPSNHLLRLTPTGAVDHTFAVGTGPNSTVQALTLQPDGRVILAGSFSTFNGHRRGGLVRLSATGALDLSFGVPWAFGTPSSPINVVTPLADGAFLVGSTTRQDFVDRIVSGLMLLEAAPSPTLLSLPFGGAVAAGNTTTVLGVSAAASQPATYQWKRNNVVVTDDTLARLGATTTTLSFVNFQASDAGTYTVTVTDSGGASVTSPPVVLTVIESAPSLGNISANFGPTLQAGTAGFLSASLGGSTPTSFAWTKNGAPVSGGFLASGLLQLPLTPARPSDAGVYQATVTNALGTVTSAPVRVWVSEEAGWTPHNPLPSPQGLLALYVDNGQFFAGGVRGARVSSPDGVTWNQLPSLSQNNVFTFLTGNGRRLLVGSLGFVALSADGITWRTSALPNLPPVQGSAFGAGLFVVSTTYVGAPGGLAKIYTSPDGEVWTERYSTQSSALNSLTYGNGTFALFTGDAVLRSADGFAWTSHPAPATGSFIRFANGQFFLASAASGDLHVSTDALTWTTRSYGSTGARDITYANNQYLLTGDSGLLLTSPNATTWTRRITNINNALRSAAYNAGTWVVLGNTDYPATILTSTDSGATWTNRTTSLTYNTLHQLATDGTSSLIAVGPNGTIARSTNGTTWSLAASGVTDELEGATYGAGRYIVTGASGRILTSTDAGVTWTNVTSGTTAYLDGANFLNDRFYANGDLGLLLTSTNGTTWTSSTVADGRKLRGMAYGSGRYVAVAAGGRIITSLDGTTWTPTTSGTTADLNGVAFGNGKFLVTSATAVFSSSDGLVWTSAPAPEIPNWDSGTLFINGRFFAGLGTNGIISSIDGLTWTGHHLGTNYSDINGVVTFNGRLYVTGNAGMIYSAALAPSILQQPVNQVFAAGLPLTLRVIASGNSLPTTYQWRKGGEAIPTATSATFTIPTTAATDVGIYDVVVTTSAGSVTSAPAALSLAVAPAIVTQPTAAVVRAGGTLTLQVTASGSFPFTYQWRKGTTPIDGATAPFYSKHGFAAGDVGNYDVIVTNAGGSVTSAVAAVTLAPAIGTLASDPAFTRPDFKSDALAGRATVDSTGRVYATWTNSNVISGVGNQLRGAVIRFNADGTVDNTFNIGAALVDAWPIVLQSDGRILVGGIASNESSETGFALPRVFRFNADGTRDFSYFSPHFAAIPRFMTMQPDGKLLVVASSTTTANGGIPVMARLNSDGSLDSNFTQPTLSASGSIFLPPVVDASGNIYVGGVFSTINGVSRPAVARLLATGVVDTGFVPAGFTVAGGTQVRGLALQTQGANAGKLVVAGGPLNVSGVNRPVIRLLSTGALDTTFTLVTQADAGMSVRPRLLNTLGDDRFYVVGSTVTRFLADGAVDTSYTKPTFSTEFFWMDTMADGRVVVPPELGATINGNPAPTLVRLTATGAVDPTFAPARVNREIYPGRFAVLPDSKLLTWGQFDRANSTPVPGIARFHPNGSLDSGFTVTGVPDLRYIAFAELGADGRILAGTRTGTNPTALTSGVVRLQPDGALDPSFTLDASLAGSTNGMEFRLLPESKVSVWSLSAQGLISDSNFLRRLTATGAVDVTFNATGFGTFGSVYRAGGATGAITSITLGSFRVLAHDSAGRQYARGTTGSYPANAASLAFTIYRAAPDGTLDTTFTAPVVNWSTSVSFPTVTDSQTNGGTASQVNATIANGSPFAGAVPVSGGKLLVYGIFTTLGGQPAPGIARLTATGALDTTFNVGTGAQLRYQPSRTAQVEGVTVAADGKIWVTGAFDTFSGVQAPGIVRLNADGTVDPNFATDIFYRTYLGGLAQVGFAPNGTVYVSGTYGRGGDAFPSAFQALVNSSTPVISTQPVAAQNLALGATATFAVTATGTDLTFQWRKNGENIAGATTASYTINPVAVTDSGLFDVVIANGAGSVASRGSVLAVSSTVALRDQPVARRVAAGATVQFSVSATTTTAGATLTYQWRKDAAPISGATLATLQLLRVTNADAAAYSVVVSDGTNSVTTQPAGLVVTAPDPLLWQQFTEFSTEQAPARTVHDGAGKVYVPWSVQDRGPDMANGKFVGALARFDENTGVLDPTFRLDRRIRGANHVVVLPGGKLLIATRLGDASSVVRVTTTGEIDPTFTSPLFARAIRFITRQADDKVIVVAADNLDPNAPASAIGADAAAVYRLDANGALDATFTRVLVNNGNVFGPPVVDSSGRIYLAGSFNQLNGTSRYGMARLTSTGALDTAYAVVANLPAGSNYTQIRSVALQSDGRAVFVGDFRYTARGTSADRIMAVRFNTDGTFDTTFAQPLQTQLGIAASSGLRLRHLVILPDDKIVAVSDRVVRLTANGAPDATFSSRVFGKEAFWLSVGATGRIFVPDQTSIAGQATPQSTISNGIVTTLADGTPDFSFQTGGWGRIAYPDQGVVLADGRIIMAGEFNRIGGRAVPGLVLLEADGAVSATQSDPTHSHQSSAVTAAGGAQVYALIDRAFNSSETGAPQLVRGVPGTPADTSFVPVLPAGYSLSSARLHAAPDRKLVLAQGSVTAAAALAGSVGDALLRLNSDGSRDTGYTPTLSAFAVVERNASNQVTAIKTGGLNVAQILPDGRALVVVSAVDGNLRLLRLAADGTIDAAFNAPSFGTIAGSSGFTTTLLDPVTSTTAQYPITTYSASDLIRAAVQMPDGKIYVGGRFQVAGSPRGLVRLNANGTLDSTFTGAGLASVTADAAPYVDSLVSDGLGRLYVGGRFGSINGSAVAGLARFTAAGALDTAWTPGFAVLDAPVAAVQLIVANGKLHALGTVGLPGDTLPVTYRSVALSGAPTASPFEASPGTVVTLAAVSGLSAATSVTFNGVSAAFTVVSDGQITATVPTLATSGPIVISGAPGPIATIGTFTVTSSVALRDQPVARKVAAGATVQLSVSATTITAGATLTYQWRKDGNVLAGLTASNLTLIRVTPADAGAYTVVVSDGTNSVTSHPAALTVTTPDPVLWQQFTEFSAEQAPARTVHDGAGKVYFPWSIYDRNPNMANGRVVGALARFDETTGALDPDFRLDARFRGAEHVVVQPDGKLLVVVSVGDASTVARVTTAGAIDTVTPFTAPLFARGIRFITRQPDGKVLVVATDILDANAPASALGADAPAVYRVNADGTLDSGFARVVINTGGVFGPPVVDSTGRIYLAGSFNQVNGTPRLGVARLSSTGTLDSTFPTGLPAGFNYSQIRAVALQSGDRPVFVGDFYATGYGSVGDRVMALRFTSAGAFDTTFGKPLRSELGLGTNLRLRHLLVEPDDTILAVSDRVVRLTADGAKDPTFTSRVFGKESFWLSRGANQHLFVPDQTSVFGQSIPLSTISNGVAVLAPNGAGVSFQFQTGGWGRSAHPTAAAVLSDGRFWVAGEFNRLGATPVPGLALFEADGTPSTAQIGMPRSMALSTVAPTLNDHIFAIVGQPVTSSESGLPASLVRLTPGLTADSGFAPVLPAGYDFSTASLNPAPAGKVVLAQGAISAQAALNGTVGDSMIRLNANGTRDTDYAPALSSFAIVERNGTNQVTAIKTGGLNVAQVLPDGRALIIASAVDGSVRLQRLTSTGAADTTFNAPSFAAITPASGFTTNLLDPQNPTAPAQQYPISTYSASDLVRTAVQMPDGKVYVGGRFQLAYANAPRGLARLNANGSLDTTFTGSGIAFSKADAGPYVSKLAVDSVGRLYVAGRLDSFNGSAVPGLFRLAGDGTLDASWNPGFAVLDAPRADVNLVIAGDKLHAFGTVSAASGPLPAFYRAVTLSGSPVMAPATGSGGTVVTIDGFAFTGTTAVRFNGLDAAFVVTSENRITATVPALATNGAITIHTPAGTQTAAGAFTITAGPNLVNISNRGLVGTGENALLANFTVEGNTKTVLLRAVGPTLAGFGVTGTLADPVLTVHDGTGAEIARNDDWPAALASDFMSVGAFPLTAGSKDSALKLTLAPGTYTARVSGAAATTGQALLEAYSVGSAERLSHLALRARAGTGADTSIAGFVVSGTGQRTVLIRAVGSPLVPALGAATNPRLQVYSGSTLIAQNEDWAASADLTAATAAAGALPLAATDSALLLALAPGSYTAQVTSSSGTGFVLTEIHAIDSFRTASFKPALLAPLQNTSVAAGAAFTLNAPVLAKPAAVTYVWKKDGAAVTTGVSVVGSPGALHLPSALTTDTGLYTVEMTNTAGTTVSAPATVSVAPPAGYSATHAVAGTGGYVAGGTVTITNTLTYVAPSQSLGWSVTLPAGWSYVSSSGEAGDTRPTAGATGNISWAWTTVPSAGSVTFTYTLAVPAGETVPRALTAFAIARPGGNPVVFVANPNPLLVAPLVAHSADTNQDFRIGLIELTRVIELFNTRNGTVRTGRYAVATTATEDGFVPDPVTAPGATVTLTRYHSADTARTATRDGKIDLFELTRVIELYNTRAGTVRTGAYRAAAGTEDGYESIP